MSGHFRIGRDRLATNWNIEFVFLEFQYKGRPGRKDTSPKYILDRSDIRRECIIKNCYCKHKDNDIEDRFFEFGH